MSDGNSTNTSALKNQLYNLTKQFFVYDGNGRVTTIYTATTDAAHGKPCSRVRYTYTSPTSANIQMMKEDNWTWDQAWDELT